mmetsp:Transcript_65176/g.128665  ORF Transcript_65176/g.128665 Transcript_65176/m.128665 type:complete len:153 (+) Transcript_65176:72-530(+)
MAATPTIVQTWEATAANLESLDQEVTDIRNALREKSAQRALLAARETALRQQLSSQCSKKQMRRLLAETTSRSEGHSHDRPAVAESPVHVPDDEQESLDLHGAVKCGLCGLRFPLGDGRLEEHYEECEAARRRRDEQAGIPHEVRSPGDESR